MTIRKDCVQASIAHALDINYDDSFDALKHDDWIMSLRYWSKSIGYIVYVVVLPKDKTIKDSLVLTHDMRFIGIFQSPRGAWDHAVVLDEDMNIVFDTYNDPSRLTELKYLIVFKKANSHDGLRTTFEF